MAQTERVNGILPHSAQTTTNETIDRSIIKTNKAAKKTFNEVDFTPSSLRQREITTGYDHYKNQLMAMDPEELRALDKEAGQNRGNYLVQIQILVGTILAKFSEITDNDRAEKAKQKIKYANSNKQWGELEREKGNRGVKFTGAALGLMFAQFLFPAAGDREIVSFLANQGCQNLAGMFNSDSQSKQRMVEGVSQMAMNEINAAMNKTTPNNEQFTRVLDEGGQVLRAAARAN